MKKSQEVLLIGIAGGAVVLGLVWLANQQAPAAAQASGLVLPGTTAAGSPVSYTIAGTPIPAAVAGANILSSPGEVNFTFGGSPTTNNYSTTGAPAAGIGSPTGGTPNCACQSSADVTSNMAGSDDLQALIAGVLSPGGATAIADYQFNKAWAEYYGSGPGG